MDSSCHSSCLAQVDEPSSWGLLSASVLCICSSLTSARLFPAHGPLCFLSKMLKQYFQERLPLIETLSLFLT